MIGFIFGALLLLAGGATLHAESSNRIWFVMYNGAPTPSSDVAVQSLATDGGPVGMAPGAASRFVCQTNFPSFRSPYDIAVDPAMGKAYVLDNNLQGESPEYIYSFDLAGTPTQIADSAQIVYTMPVPPADAKANLYPLISGIALDPVKHLLYFDQIDETTPTNSYIGRLDLTSSSASDVHLSTNGNPTLRVFYVGQVPGQGPIALDASNLYLGAINGRGGNTGVFAAPRDGSGTFSEVVTLSAGDISFSNGLVSGVASDPQDNLVYYLTFNAGYLNQKFDTGQNALWAYDTVSRQSEKIGSGYPGFPDAIAVDPAHRRYYFTLGRDGTGNASPTNYQAIYTGSLGSTNTPTQFYTPALSGEDLASQANAGNVVLQGIYVQDPPALSAGAATAFYVAGSGPLTLASNLVVSDPGSTLLASATVAITGGGFLGDGDELTAATNSTGITAGYDGATATLTLSGSATLADYQQVLRSVNYLSTNADPTDGGTNSSRTITWTVTDGVISSAGAATMLVIGIAPPQNHLAVYPAAPGWWLLFAGNSSQDYVFQFADILSGPWTDLSPVLTATAAGDIEYHDLTSPLPPQRFYRVRTAP